jgi:hypothetical protein
MEKILQLGYGLGIIEIECGRKENLRLSIK